MIYRVDVSGKDGGDGRSVRATAAEAGVATAEVHAGRVFLIDSPDSVEKVREIAIPLLADPVVETAILTAPRSATAPQVSAVPGVLEVHLKPGVMDPVAASAELALRQAGLAVAAVRTGRSYRFSPAPAPDKLKYLGSRVLGNAVIEAVHLEPFLPESFPSPRVASFKLRHVALRDLTDAQLQDLSRTGHLFLNLTEMKALQAWYREQHRDPTDIELETIAQTWSEHCVHKTLKSAVEVNDAVNGARSYANLIKETIFQSTQQLIADGKADFCLSVFKDNAGVIALDDTDAVCFKVETHNRPSAIDPYGGAATGAGGCIRDVLGTGLGAKPIANTDVFCVAYPDHWQGGTDSGHRGSRVFAEPIEDVRHSEVNWAVVSELLDWEHVHKVRLGEAASDGTVEYIIWRGRRNDAGIKVFDEQPLDPEVWYPKIQHVLKRSRIERSLPPGVLHPKRTLTQVVAGVRDYGNRMGIPTVNGAVFFDDRYVANPLVFCGCVGLLPRTRIGKQSHAGDYIVVIGGRTGRDGIHGATFSSAELTSTHADEFSHAVQIGNAITQKKMMDVVLQAADRGLFSAITDCGAGGLSSAVGEMGEKLGAEVYLDRVPLKYEGLRYDEIWISEAQERMVVSVPPHHAQALLDLAKSEDVEATVIGHFGTDNAELKLYYNDVEVGRLAMHFLHNGIPMPTRKAVVAPVATKADASKGWWAGHVTPNTADSLLAILARPNVASKHFIVRQYDHEVQGMSVVKPFVGPVQRGPSDAAVLRPKPASRRGVAVACGLCPWIDDPYHMALASIDEAVRNVVAVGGDPERTAILDNFCWPGTDNEHAMGDLVRTAEACRDAALAYRIPFISGKDSLHNQYTDKSTGKVTRVPNTLLVSAISIVDDTQRCVTMDLKSPGSQLFLLTPTAPGFASTLQTRIATHRYLASLIRTGQVRAAHDVSDGGYLAAVAEMCIGSDLGAALTPDASLLATALDERIASYVLELTSQPPTPPEGVAITPLGKVTADPTLTLPGTSLPVETLTKAWTGTLDW